MRVFWQNLISVCLLLTSPAWARPASSNALVAVTEEWPPYQFTAANGDAAGLNVEIVRAVLAEAGLKAQIKIYPWARTFSLGENRPNTLIFSLARSHERENAFIWIGELMRRNDWFYRANGRESVSPTTLDDIKACCTICVVRKDIVEEDLKRLGFTPGRHYIVVSDFSDCMRLVENGSVPLLVDSPQDLTWSLKQVHGMSAGFQPIMPLPNAEQEPFFLAASLGTSPDTVARLRSALQTLQQKGALEQIRRQFAQHAKP
jgi:polar amino acid transport system substrate-binding protein